MATVGSTEKPSDDTHSQTFVDLVRRAVDEARHLAQLELSIAREEARSDVRRAERGGTAMGMAAGLAFSAFTMLLVAIAAAFAKTWIAAVVIAAILVVFSGGLALAGWKGIPKKPMDETRRRIEADLTKVEERALS